MVSNAVEVVVICIGMFNRNCQNKPSPGAMQLMHDISYIIINDVQEVFQLVLSCLDQIFTCASLTVV